MNTALRIGLVGDHNESATAHRAIPQALALAGASLGLDVSGEWIPTESIHADTSFASFHGLWCVPASPYRNTEGALRAIRHARESTQPFLGTCGGFQHLILEYARNVLGWSDADHGESAPEANRLVITPLACALVEESETLRLIEGSHLARAHGQLHVHETYHCRFGVNPAFQSALTNGPLRAAAEFENGELRAVELEGHPFFVGTLFQPERAAFLGRVPPIVQAFVQAAAQFASVPAASG